MIKENAIRKNVGGSQSEQRASCGFVDSSVRPEKFVGSPSVDVKEMSVAFTNVVVRDLQLAFHQGDTVQPSLWRRELFDAFFSARLASHTPLCSCWRRIELRREASQPVTLRAFCASSLFSLPQGILVASLLGPISSFPLILVNSEPRKTNRKPKPQNV